MWAGALYVMMERYDYTKYLDLCKEHKVTVLAGMPPVIHSLTEAPRGPEQSLATVREIISGGGPLHHDIWKKFYYRYNIPVINAYGLSETVLIGTGTVIRPEDYASADRFQSVGYLDKDLRLFLTDRKKDMIVMSGWKIYPTEVEDVLIGHEGVDEIAVFGIPDEHRGEMPAAAVVWRRGWDSSDKEGSLREQYS